MPKTQDGRIDRTSVILRHFVMKAFEKESVETFNSLKELTQTDENIIRSSNEGLSKI